MSHLKYDEGRIIERYRVWIIHISMIFLTMTLGAGLAVLFFKILKYIAMYLFAGNY